MTGKELLRIVYEHIGGLRGRGLVVMLDNTNSSAAKMAAVMFDAGRLRGQNHSARAGTLPIYMNYMEATGRPYRLTAYPGKGYYLEEINPLETMEKTS